MHPGFLFYQEIVIRINSYGAYYNRIAIARNVGNQLSIAGSGMRSNPLFLMLVPSLAMLWLAVRIDVC